MLPKETLHAYLDEYSLKIAKTRLVAGKKVLAGLYYKNINGVSDSSIPQEIRYGMKLLGAGVKQVNLLLSSKYVITKSIEVPSLDEKEIEDIVKLQAVRHTPYSKDEVIVGHINLEIVLKRYTKTLLVLVSNEIVRKRTAAFELAGFEVDSTHLVCEILSKIVSQSMLVGEASEPTGLLYFDSHLVDLMILKDGKPFYIRSIPIGISELKQEDGNLHTKQLLDEVKKTLEVYQNEEGAVLPKTFLVLGIDSPEQSDFIKLVESQLKIKTQMTFISGKLPMTDETKKDFLRFSQASLVDVMADSMIGEGPCLNLLPEDLKIRKMFRARGRQVFMAGMFAMIIFIFTISIFLTKIYFRSTYLKELRSNFQAKESEATNLVGLSDETRIIRAFDAKRGRTLKILSELQMILPKEMYLNELVLTNEDKLTIKGTSDLMSAVFSFVTEFENSPYFKNVSPDYTKSRKENDRDVSDFGITTNLEEEGFATNG